jgi:predicted regulator of Ras-like GTPase activity (Roadblock/LC7/MglB family)
MVLSKTKFAGFLRGLFGRGEYRAPARQTGFPAPALAPVPASLTSTQAPPAYAPAAKNGLVPLKAAPPLAAAAAKTAPDAGSVELPVLAIIAALPMEFRAKVASAPAAGLALHLPAEKVISQLAFGAVKISFGELRRLTPGVFVNSGGDLDNKLVNLPLQEILARLNPALLARRAAKKVEVTEEIVGPFAEHGRGFSFTTQPLKGSSAPAPTPPPAPEPPVALVPPMGVRQNSPPAITPLISHRSITPTAPSATPDTHLEHVPGPLPISPLSPRAITPATPGAIDGNGYRGHGPASNGQVNHGQGTNGHGNSLPATPGLRTASLNGNTPGAVPAPLKLSTASQPGTEPAETTVSAALTDLCGMWPDAIKNEISSSSLAHARVALLSTLILPGLKRGRIVVPWKQLRLLALPGSDPSPNDKVELEVPLKVIAPLFVAAQMKPQHSQTKASVSAEIPDLFFGFPQPSAAAPAPAAPVVPPLPKTPDQAGPDTNYYTLADKAGGSIAEDAAPMHPLVAPQTDFSHRLSQPKEVVARATALPGVAGAIVAMQDGLRVACQVPGEFNGDTLAAFLPQIFERVNQCTRELRMGALNNVNFTVGNVPWKIFRVNSVYFAAFGRTGEPLPSAQLAQLAAELDRKKSS